MKPSEQITTEMIIKAMQALSVIMVMLTLLMLLPEHDHELYKQNEYCEMVSMYVQSGGDIGWPDYKGIYNSACGVRA